MDLINTSMTVKIKDQRLTGTFMMDGSGWQLNVKSILRWVGQQDIMRILFYEIKNNQS